MAIPNWPATSLARERERGFEALMSCGFPDVGISEKRIIKPGFRRESPPRACVPTVELWSWRPRRRLEASEE